MRRPRTPPPPRARALLRGLVFVLLALFAAPVVAFAAKKPAPSATASASATSTHEPSSKHDSDAADDADDDDDDDVEPSASAAPSTSEHKSDVEGVVRLKDRKVFTLALEREGRSASDRAKKASEALEAAFNANEDPARYELKKHVAIVFLGNAPIVEVDEDDAADAGAETLDAYAADLASQVKLAVAQERQRGAIANTVFSFSLVVFSALIAFLLLGKSTGLAERAKDWLEDNPDRIPSLRLGGIELLRAGAIRGFLGLAIAVGKRVMQVGVLYAWLLFSLSLFEATRAYTKTLSGLVLGPLSAFASRIGSSLPLAVATAIAIAAVALLVRVTGVFFQGVARGETTIEWVPRDLATPVGVIVRIGIIVVGLIVSAPLLTGADDGILSRAGVAALFAFAVAATPILACGTVGATIIFTRRLRPGDFVELGNRTGRVRDVTLLEVTIEDAAGCAVRVPHLYALLHPTRVMGPTPVVAVELVIDPRASQVRVREVLTQAASKVNVVPRIDLLSIDADGALYRVVVGAAAPSVAPAPVASKRTRSNPGRSVPPPPMAPKIVTTDDVAAATSTQLTSVLVDALAAAGIALGRRAYGAGSP